MKDRWSIKILYFASGASLLGGAMFACENVEGGLEPEDGSRNVATGGQSTNPSDPMTEVGGFGGGTGKATGGAAVAGDGDGDGDNSELERCFFAELDDAPAPPGVGGAPAGTGAINRGENAFLGELLVQQDGIALYTYGGDQPGTCTTAPSSGCSADCAIAWPPFVAHQGALGEELNESDFGVFLRADGALQSTFRGWPLYTFKKDAEAATPQASNDQLRVVKRDQQDTKPAGRCAKATAP